MQSDLEHPMISKKQLTSKELLLPLEVLIVEEYQMKSTRQLGTRLLARKQSLPSQLKSKTSMPLSSPRLISLRHQNRTKLLLALDYSMMLFQRQERLEPAASMMESPLRTMSRVQDLSAMKVFAAVMVILQKPWWKTRTDWLAKSKFVEMLGRLPIPTSQSGILHQRLGSSDALKVLPPSLLELPPWSQLPLHPFDPSLIV